MQKTREEVLNELLKSFSAYYDITVFDEEHKPLTARCEYFEHSEKYVLSRRAELWSADSEEFLYLLDISHLTPELFEEWKTWIYEDGMKRLHIGPGHMCSVITSVFVCSSCEKEAVRALKRCRIYKSFHFSLHGWMNFRAILVEVDSGQVTANRAGSGAAKSMKKILTKKKRSV